MKVFAVNNPNSEIRRQSSSGGAFSLLAESVISEGGVVYGVSFNDTWDVIHRRVDSIDGLAKLRGSKYVYSHVGTAYDEVVADLETRRKVLFSGTPCQVAAMRKRVGNNAHLMLVEIVCHGAPQPQYWKKYLSEICQRLGKQITDIDSINFRDKRTGWKNYSFTIKFVDNTIFSQPHDDNLYMRAFLRNYTLRKACFRCPFKYPHRSKADITLGDFWGISQIAPDIDNDFGTTLVITHNNLKDTVFKKNSIYHNVSFEKVVKYNPAIIDPPEMPLNWNLFQNEVKDSTLITKLKKYAGRPLSQIIYLFLARLKNRLKNR